MFKKIICILVSIAFICCANPVPLSSGVIAPNNPVLPLGGRDDYKEIITEYDYDDYGDVIQISQLGDTSNEDDQRQINKDHAYLDTDENFLIRQVHEEKLDDIGGQKVAEQFFIYDDNTGWENQVLTLGELKKQISWLNTEANPDNWPTQNFAYDDYGNVISKTDANGNETQIEYDSENYYSIYPTKITNALLQETQQTFDLASGKMLTQIDPNDAEVQYTYDEFYRPEKIIGPYDNETYPGVTYEYDYDNQPIRVTKNQRIIPQQPDENNLLASHTFYDGLGRVIQDQLPAEDDNQVIVVNKTYNSKDLVIEQYIPYYDTKPAQPGFLPPLLTQPKLVLDYDALNRQTQVTNTDGSTRTNEYLDSEWKLITTDENDHQKESVSNAYGKITQVVEHNERLGQPEQYVTGYTYDKNDNLIKITDSASPANDFIFEFDSLNRKISINDPDLGAWQYAYDKNGNLTRQTDARGNNVKFTYDSLNRLLKKESDSAVRLNYVRLIYDDASHSFSIGRLSKVLENGFSEDFYYDKLGRVITDDKNVAGELFSLGKTYDSLGRVMAIAYPDGETVAYTYNAQGVESIQNNVGNVDYNAQGKMVDIYFANGMHSHYDYYDNPEENPDYRLKTILTTDTFSTPLQNLAYDYDAVGNITLVRDNIRSENYSYGYDQLNRLILAQGPAVHGNIAYDYDSIGNLVQQIRSGRDIVNYFYGAGSAGPHALTSTDAGFSASYDACGNMVQRNGETLRYDIFNRLIACGGANYTYNYTNQRVLKNDSSGKTYYPDNLFEILKPRISPHAYKIIHTKHIFMGPRRIASYEDTGSAMFYHPNHLGSAHLVSNGAGEMSQEFGYLPFGESFREIGQDKTKYRYNDKELDQDSGLYYYGARYYDPEVQHFITADSLIPSPYDPQSLNRYAYCLNNPMKMIDPDGHVVAVPVILAGAAIAGAIFNVAANWSDITSKGNIDFGKAAGYAAVGGVAGVIGAVGGLAAVTAASAAAAGTALVATLGYAFAGGFAKSVGNDYIKSEGNIANVKGNLIADATFSGIKSMTINKAISSVANNIVPKEGSLIDALMKRDIEAWDTAFASQAVNTIVKESIKNFVTDPAIETITDYMNKKPDDLFRSMDTDQSASTILMKGQGSGYQQQKKKDKK